MVVLTLTEVHYFLGCLGQELIEEVDLRLTKLSSGYFSRKSQGENLWRSIYTSLVLDNCSESVRE